jgi:ribosomal protein L7/L12
MDFKTALLAMASARPDAEVSLIVDLALAVENATPPSLDDPQALGNWAARQPSVARELAVDKRIHAIKELRSLTRCSLVQAKNAIDAI